MPTPPSAAFGPGAENELPLTRERVIVKFDPASPTTMPACIGEMIGRVDELC